MKIKASWVASGIVLASVIVSLSNNGCGDDSDSNDMASRTGRKGEACQTTHDCAPGLACLPGSTNFTGSSSSIKIGGTCVVGLFNVAPTNKECAHTQCETVQDCCTNVDPTSSFCMSAKTECESPNPPLGSESLCASYRQQCVCDENKRGCEAGFCITKCVDDAACKNAGGNGDPGKCVAGKCGECSVDTDCKDKGTDLTCVNAKCQAPCKGDGDCAGFDRCLNGKCIEGGCQSTRECIASTRNVEATCGTDGKCITPCQTDLECGNPTGYSFFSCLNNQCVYVGCETDKDCRLFLAGPESSTSSSGGSSSKNDHYVCRDKGIPGNIVLTR